MEPTTRDGAAVEIDRLLDVWNEPSVDGRCQSCEAIVTQEPFEPGQEQRLILDPGRELEDWNYSQLRIEHSDGCPVPDALRDAVLLAAPWGFEFEDVVAFRLVGGNPAFFVRKRRIPD
ncbi:MAG: hypothetical protein M3O98_03295 [Actinomycetota bacterium]|nr:hypothetical protein [Actinomycetota bacterium]